VFGLAWRLHRAPLVGLAVAFALLGAALGWVAAAFDGLLSASPALARWLAPLGGATLGDAFVALSLYVLVAILASSHAVAAALRARAEEDGAHLAWILATPTSRARWLGSHVLFAAIGPLVLALAAGASVGLVDALATGRTVRLTSCITAALSHLPAAWVMGGLGLALFGRLPRAAAAVTWGLLAFFTLQVALWEGGAIARPWFNPLTYSHPMLALNLAHLLALVLAGLALGTAGVLAFRARDIL
jgi:ABC-2 type transport system permease protein